MKTYWNIDKNLTVLNEWQPNCWIQVTCPTDEDQRLLEEEFKIPDYFLSDISDTDERARYEYDDGWMLIILRIPYVKEIRSRTPYTTVPLGIIHKRDVTITVCYYETNMMIDFVSYQQKRSEGFTDYVDMTFRLFLSSAVWYLKRLKQINSLIEKAKRNLDHGVNNESLIGLSRLQDSLNVPFGEEERFLTRDEQGMVVCHLAVVHAAACRGGFCPHLVFPFGLCADESEQFGNFGKHVFGDVAASRSRIGYQLLFVEFLRDFKRLFRREAVLGVGFFLERGQVVEQGSFLRLLLALGFRDSGATCRLYLII